MQASSDSEDSCFPLKINLSASNEEYKRKIKRKRRFLLPIENIIIPQVTWAEGIAIKINNAQTEESFIIVPAKA